jgi:hypothetical protein
MIKSYKFVAKIMEHVKTENCFKENMLVLDSQNKLIRTLEDIKDQLKINIEKGPFYVFFAFPLKDEKYKELLKSVESQNCKL